MWTGGRNTDEIADCDGNAAAHDDEATFLESVGKIDDSDERGGANNVDWDGHIVDTEGSIARVRSVTCSKASTTEKMDLPETGKNGR